MTAYAPSVTIGSQWGTVLLSLRDLRFGVPINYNAYTGVSLTPACFADRRYTSDKATCVANFISLGFGRFVVDVYLDGAQGTWGICPVATARDADAPTSAATAASTVTPSGDLSALPIATEAASPTASVSSEALRRRNESRSPGSAGGDLGNASSVLHLEDADGAAYTCDSSFNLSSLLAVFDAWAGSTETNLAVRVGVLEFNLHPTSSSSSSNSSSGSSDASGDAASSPQPLSSVLSSVFAGDPYNLYTPAQLRVDRANLNNSWLNPNVNQESINRAFDVGTVANEYYTTSTDSDGTLSTADGWPNEEYLEFEIRRRLLAVIGSVDTALEYDANAKDGGVIFPAGYLGNDTSASKSKNATCHYEHSDNSVAGTNASWALLWDSPAESFPANATTTDYSRCGLGLVLNASATQDEYYSILQAANAWAWADGEPSPTATPSSSSTSLSSVNFRCAAFSAVDGTWRTSDCRRALRPACRIQRRPYAWTLGRSATAYYHASASASNCPSDSSFSAPRNALENQYLLAAVRSDAQAASLDEVWIDLNSLAVPGCWVTGGADANCPYRETDYDERKVIVPTVAAVILLIISALACCAKLGTWRAERVRRKRRKMVKRRRKDGVDYEGVPS